jgi:hypothetical protein
VLFRETVGTFLQDRTGREVLDERRTFGSPTIEIIENLAWDHLSGDRVTFRLIIKQAKAMLWEHQTEDNTATWVEVGNHRMSVTTPGGGDQRHEFMLFERNGCVVRQKFGLLLTETKPTRSLFVTGISNRWAEVDHETLNELTDALEAAGCFASAKIVPEPQEQAS